MLTKILLARPSLDIASLKGAAIFLVYSIAIAAVAWTLILDLVLAPL